MGGRRSLRGILWASRLLAMLLELAFLFFPEDLVEFWSVCSKEYQKAVSYMQNRR